jgi:uncharacterized membrane-anchored protein
MQSFHLPTPGPRYWVSLCIASIFGANMGDFFAGNIGLGHLDGLPFLAMALAIVMIAERFDRLTHQAYYWVAIIIVRTAATNFADFACSDLKLPRLAVMAGLSVLLALALWISWQWVWRSSADKANQTLPALRADLGYWICMFIAGTLGTVIGDYSSHNLRLDDGGAALLLSPIVAALFLVGRNGLLLWLPFYWLTVVAIRTAGTAVGDFTSGRQMLGLPLSTLITGLALVACLAVWHEPARSTRPLRID